MSGLAWISVLVLAGCGDNTSDDSSSSDDTGTDTDTETDTGDSGETTEDPCADPVVTFTTEDGTETDLTQAFLIGEYRTLAVPGTLSVCPGTWFSRFLVRADVSIVGLGNKPGKTVLSGGESGTILDIAGPDVHVSVENVTFDRGAGLDVEHNSGGGGIYCDQEGALTITDAKFTNNTANDGAALYARDCVVDVSSAKFSDNVSEDDGGAVTLWYSTATFDDVTLEGNDALDGGAMAMFFSDLTATNTTFDDNTASIFAGGIWAYESNIDLSDVTISNAVNDGTDHGGGLLVQGSATLENVTFQANSAPLGGGLYVYYDAVVQGTNCSFLDNAPDDIYAADYTAEGGVSYTAGSGYSFTCQDNACSSN